MEYESDMKRYIHIKVENTISNFNNRPPTVVSTNHDIVNCDESVFLKYNKT
jgi:hypothetical protein